MIRATKVSNSEIKYFIQIGEMFEVIESANRELGQQNTIKKKTLQYNKEDNNLCIFKVLPVMRFEGEGKRKRSLKPIIMSELKSWCQVSTYFI